MNVFELKLNKNTYDDNSVFVNVQLRLKNDTITSKQYDFQLFVGGHNLNDFVTPSNLITTDVLKLNNQDTVVCDKTLVSVDKTSEQR